MSDISECVATSYDSVAKSHSGDMNSTTTPFRAFNNCVKRLLINAGLANLRQRNQSLKEAAVLDLASGRGGDIGKWIVPESSDPTRLRISYYDCFDISQESINEAEKRYHSLKDTNAIGRFQVANCFEDTFLEERLPSLPLYRHYSIVSIQFAFHYACDTEQRIAKLMKAIAEALHDGGVFIATTVDEVSLSNYVRAGTESSLFDIKLIEPVEWVTSFASKTPKLKIGSQYHFKLLNFVDSPEYVVPMMIVKKYAAIYGLVEDPKSSKGFVDFLESHKKSFSRDCQTELSHEEKELVQLYRTLCFVKEKGKPQGNGGGGWSSVNSSSTNEKRNQKTQQRRKRNLGGKPLSTNSQRKDTKPKITTDITWDRGSWGAWKDKRE